jgi:hypothetical protein
MVCMNSVCIAVIYFSHSRVCMNSVCIAVIYFSHSRVCMNSVCIAVIYFTVTVGYVWTVFVLLLYISAIQTLFIHSLLWLWNIYQQCKHCSCIPYCDCEIYNSNTNIAHTYPTVTVKYITAIQTLLIHTLLWLWNTLYISQSQ